jgi:uncharacterized protein YqjF (DUF2071 family)
VTTAFDRGILNVVTHRPWPMPDGAWLMTQTWNDLLFAHWAVSPATVRAEVPAGFALDLFDGQAWIGVVPFYMTNVGPRGAPALPWISAFPELNVRTYVRVGERPGVYFFSLDAGNRLAVGTARLLLNLPYHRATMAVNTGGGVVEYMSRRHGAGEHAAFSATCEPLGTSFTPTNGSLEHFLTERYCLYNLSRRGAPYRLDIHHPPWSLQRAKARIAINTVASAAGFALPDGPQLLHYSRRQDMVAWAPAMIG